MRFLLANDNQLSSFRINTLQGVIFLLIVVIVGRLFYIQVIQHDFYIARGLEQRSVIRDITPERGRIFALASEADGNDLYPLAINKVYYEVSVDPSLITRPQNVTDIFAATLELEEEETALVLDKVKNSGRRYELLDKEVPREKVEELQTQFEALRLDINKGRPEEEQLKSLADIGVNFLKNVLRYYPDEEIGSHIIGFLGYGSDGYSRVGNYGLEGYWQSDLAGNTGQLIGETDVAGRLLANRDGQVEENGADITLTIDRTVQYSVCKSLEKSVAQFEADSGSVIVMETDTGAIKAMCTYPSFDPNKYGEVASGDVYNNNSVYDVYEPGSVMKSIAMAVAIDQGKVAPDTLYNDEGEIKFASGHTIRNSDLKANGVVDMKDVLALSLNTGIIFATSEVNNKIYEDYMRRFGFGKSTGIALSQDTDGDISSLAKTGDIFKATASYGQGITVSPLQMVSAINAIANRGELMKPYIVSQVAYSDGRQDNFEPSVVRQVIDKSTAAQISAMMVNVVDSGHADQAAVAGYFVAGKTGTAQVPNSETGKYDTDKTIHNFVGFAPNDNPKFSMITKLDNPKVASFSASTAAPLFGEIAKFLLEYYSIAPSR